MSDKARYVHPAVVRFTHWLNALVLTIMIGSGLQIFAAFPSFGPKIPQHDLMVVPEIARLGGWLGGALQWHLAFAWLFSGSGLAYVVYQACSAHWRQTLFMPSEASGLWPMARYYLAIGPKPTYSGEYNPLQKLAYTFTILCGALAMATGFLLYKPVQLQTAAALLGGFELVRVAHFVSMCGFIAFIPGHLLMVALHGWNNFQSMLTGYTKRPMMVRHDHLPR